MRFPRNAKVFRGQLDAAPVAGVFFLLALMLLLHSQIVFTPGVRVDLAALGATNRWPTLQADLDGKLSYLGDSISFESLTNRWQEEAKKGEVPTVVQMFTEPGTPDALLEKIRLGAKEVGVTLMGNASRIDLPIYNGLPGTTNGIVVVAVNLSGQLFFENQLILEQPLRQRLIEAVQRARTPLSLVLQADREIPYETILHLGSLARQAGLAEILLATRPQVGRLPRPLESSTGGHL